MPGVGLDGVRISSNSKHDHGVCRDRPRSTRSSCSCQRLEGGRDIHCVGVDEGEEENISGLLLPLEQLRLLFPLSVALVTVLVIVSQENIQPQHFPRPGWVAPAPEGGCGGRGVGVLSCSSGARTPVIFTIHHDTLQHRTGSRQVVGFEMYFQIVLPTPGVGGGGCYTEPVPGHLVQHASSHLHLPHRLVVDHLQLPDVVPARPLPLDLDGALGAGLPLVPLRGEV